MIVWVLYDIKKDKARTRVAKLCKLSGIYRVQYSAFLGTMQTNELDTLRIQIEELIDKKTDRVYMFPMSKDELQRTVLLGQAFDKNLITDKVRELFF